MTITIFLKFLVVAIAILTTGNFQSDQSVGKVGAKLIFALNDANHPALSYDGKHLVVCPEVGTTDGYDIGAGRKLQTFRVPESADYTKILTCSERTARPAIVLIASSFHVMLSRLRLRGGDGDGVYDVFRFKAAHKSCCRLTLVRTHA